MTEQEFIKNCPGNAHLSHFNLKGKGLDVVSAKGYNIEKDGVPGRLSLVWNQHGEAYSRDMTLGPVTDMAERNRVILYDGQVYVRRKVYDLRTESAEKTECAEKKMEDEK